MWLNHLSMWSSLQSAIMFTFCYMHRTSRPADIWPTGSICVYVQFILHSFLLWWRLVRRPSRREHHSISGFPHSKRPCPRPQVHLPCSSFFSSIIQSLSNLRTFDLIVSLPGTADSSYNKLLALLGISGNIMISSGDSLTSTATQLKNFSHWFTHPGESPVYLPSSPPLPNLPPYLPNTLSATGLETRQWCAANSFSLTHLFRSFQWHLPGLPYFPWDFLSSPPCEVTELVNSTNNQSFYWLYTTAIW